MTTTATEKPHKVEQSTHGSSLGECAVEHFEALSPLLKPLYETECEEHSGLCAYNGDEIDHCPWCHCAWTVIERSGWHTCEKASTWDNSERHARIATARQMREEARNAL